MAKTDTDKATITLTADQISGLLDAASYWESAEGGNNFEGGYSRGADGKEERRVANLTRAAMKKLERKLEELNA